MKNDQLKALCDQAVKAGLEYYLRGQNCNIASADYGRFPFIVNCQTRHIESWTSNWITGIQTSVMLNAYRTTGDERFMESVRRAVVYLKSLQEFRPWQPATWGAIHEETPQDVQAHPRDGLSAALGLLDYATFCDDEEALRRAKLFGDWFITYGMENGYPHWTLRFDSAPWEPRWYGSFHSGSAYFLTRLGVVTGDARYVHAAQELLDFYNTNLLQDSGEITVIRERASGQVLDDHADPAWAPDGWIRMHQFNDDFGALANMYLGQVTKQEIYSHRAVDFLKRMQKLQRSDGGYGPEKWRESIPNAGGMILIELTNAQRLNLVDEKFEHMATQTAEYLLNQQFRVAEHPFDGAFHGMTGEYTVDKNYCNARATTYAILGLMNYAGWKTPCYSASI